MHDTDLSRRGGQAGLDAVPSEPPPVGQPLGLLLDHSIFRRRTAAAYAAAAALVGIALLVRLAIAPVEAGVPYVTFFPAVLLACFLGGAGPAVVAAILAAAAAVIFFLPPWGEAKYYGQELWSVASFLVAVAVGCAPIELLRRRVHAHERVEAVLRGSEEQLKDGQARLRGVVETAVDGVVTIDEFGRIETVNGAIERIFGYAAEELVGRNVSLLMPEPYRSEHDRYLESYRRTGERRIIGIGREVFGRRKDGAVFPIYLAVSEVRLSRGRRLFTGITRDISAQKAAEAALRDSRERLASALLASETGTFRWAIEADILEWDDSLRRIFGLGKDQTVTRVADFLSFVHPEDRDVLMGEVERCLHERAPLSKEFRIVRPDGSVRWIADKAQVLCGADGRPLHLTGACRDETERKAAQEALRLALKQKDVLLKEVNHRVKNSLQLISSLLSLQGAAIRDREVRREFADAAARIQTVGRIHQKLYQTGDVRTVEFGSYLRDLCGELAASLSASEGDGGPRLAVETDEAALSLDRAIPLALAATELVTNAFKYAFPAGRATPAAGTVRVTGRVLPEGWLEVVVADDGIGLPDGFDPQAAGSLGMRLVHSLMTQLDGVVERRPAARGTAFALRLPLSPPEPAP